ncbi:Valine--tRNA ligase, mitochondrial 1 [Neolecta irregularis DAH-3]|uniref:valine--tRNA ligase n=1 Tax=Neolecta irregularis (strain DAH-3) TaxID=1198029 RepID=A0A1U7LS97_NEOID|nr:Valine--tRNA ligase, mitochondrial 1 [Neolecta irregularis DAH-3]|eukprot:OLL25391.1 Valine--tRNA ligase, mitochondrial 1 [Neolecta irregularis DAH-3]
MTHELSPQTQDFVRKCVRLKILAYKNTGSVPRTSCINQRDDSQLDATIALLNEKINEHKDAINHIKTQQSLQDTIISNEESTSSIINAYKSAITTTFIPDKDSLIPSILNKKNLHTTVREAGELSSTVIASIHETTSLLSRRKEYLREISEIHDGLQRRLENIEQSSGDSLHDIISQHEEKIKEIEKDDIYIMGTLRTFIDTTIVQLLDAENQGSQIGYLDIPTNRKKQETLDKYLGVGESTVNSSLGDEFKEILENLLNSVVVEGDEWISVGGDSSVVRLLVRAGIAVLNPKNTNQIKMAPFYKEIGDLLVITNVSSSYMYYYRFLVLFMTCICVRPSNYTRIFKNIQYVTTKSVRKLEKAYDPARVEQGWYDWWESQGCFQASSRSQPLGKISMLLPPPNVTGKLHIGHALTLSIQDALARWYRMSGYQVSWRPGIDHAGIATQNIVEKALRKSRGIGRDELGREKFTEQVWKWKTEYSSVITNQIKKLGASLDWENEFFTLDEPRSSAVNTAFIVLFDQGLIYRGNRMVNWSCKLGTAISDIEVNYEKVTESKILSIEGGANSIEVGVLHFIDYPLVHALPGLDKITVATTRPETIFGDRAIAIHPDIPRAKELVQNKVRHPLIPGLELPIIADRDFVDPELGTGALKITPAHDLEDYEFSKRHKIETVAIFDGNGKMTKSCGMQELEGLDRLAVRAKTCDLLNKKGLYSGKKNHTMHLARCSRSGDIIEPMLRPQWFIMTTPLAERVLDDLKRQVPRFTPSCSSKIWEQWLGNVQDWCISRQLWWGHRIPAWNIKGTEQWVAAQTEGEASKKAGGMPIVQDEDVLDTWFSSALLPLSAFGWDGKASNYPLDIVESGSDILFFWLARMALLGTHLTGQAPFKEVWLHPMVCDSHGRKMSKSLGNVIDPLHIINGVSKELLETEIHNGNLSQNEVERSLENIKQKFPKGIPALGTDALRFALVDSTIQSRKICMDENNVKSARALISKLWNAFQFFQVYRDKAIASGLNEHHFEHLPQPLLHDIYIMAKLSEATKASVEAFESKALYEATIKLRSFIIDDLCGIYLEFSKRGMWDLKENSDSSVKLQSGKSLKTLYMCMATCLKLLHPLMPFVTEEIWQMMETEPNRPSIMLSPYPQIDAFPQEMPQWICRVMKNVVDVIASFRALREKLQIPKANDSTGFVQITGYMKEDGLAVASFDEYKDEIARQTGIGKIQLVFSDESTRGLVGNVISSDLAVHLLYTKEDTKTKDLNHDQIEYLQKELNLLKARLQLPKYIEKAPAEVREKDRKRLETLERLFSPNLR